MEKTEIEDIADELLVITKEKNHLKYEVYKDFEAKGIKFTAFDKALNYLLQYNPPYLTKRPNGRIYDLAPNAYDFIENGGFKVERERKAHEEMVKAMLKESEKKAVDEMQYIILDYLSKQKPGDYHSIESCLVLWNDDIDVLKQKVLKPMNGKSIHASQWYTIKPGEFNIRAKLIESEWRKHFQQLPIPELSTPVIETEKVPEIIEEKVPIVQQNITINGPVTNSSFLQAGEKIKNPTIQTADGESKVSKRILMWVGILSLATAIVFGIIEALS